MEIGQIMIILNRIAFIDMNIIPFMVKVIGFSENIWVSYVPQKQMPTNYTLHIQ